jgi:short-subunit dehydrogenase
LNVLITGASSGIGRELVKIFVEKGHCVIAVARRKENLEEISKELGKAVISIPADLLKLENIDILYKKIKEMDIEIDLLINNAGMGGHGLFWENDLSVDMNTIDLNIRSLTYLTKIVVQDMALKKDGGIINVASTAAFQSGGPLMGVYYASKAYVLSFTEALIDELGYRGIRAMTLCPGPTATEFESMSTQRKGMEKFYITTPKEVAECCYKDYFRGKTISVPGIVNKFSILFTKFLPRKIQRKIVKKIQEKKIVL